MSFNALSHVLIAQAVLDSGDLGATLDFGHKAITDVGEYGAEELATIGREKSSQDESSVLRINLGSNRLSTLPMAFALLSSLRYLNLRNNSFSSFPDVLTIMPSLEILEIGRNKIKRLPSQPGSLSNLRIFSFYKNKITRLPTYFARFNNLEVLRCDQNPFEWPPRSIIESSSADMSDYIRSIRRWIDENAGLSDRKLFIARRLTTISISLVPCSRSTITDGPAYDPFNKSSIRDDDDDGRTPHARSFSVSSEISTYNNGAMPPIPRHVPTTSVTSSSTSRHRPLHLTLPHSSSSSTSPSPNRSPSDSYLPTPDDSVSSTDEELYREISASLGHAHNTSSSEPERDSLRPSVLIKKSLPDLRPTTRLRTTEDFSRFPPLAESPVLGDFSTFVRRNNRSLDNVGGLPSPVSNRQDSADSDASFVIARPPRHFPREPSISASGSPIERPAPPMDVERNSYFRRFSTIQPSSLKKTIPEPLLQLVDAVRGILFAVSQIYQALQHYTVYAIDDRLASILLKVLDPASAYMTQLINALDRFDSMSRRTTPTPAVCRAVIESCRDNVVAFGKAVGVLGLQLKVLATSDDDRYTRQMLLVLYGASAEIANAWQSAIAPNMHAVEPLLRDLRPTIGSKKRTAPQTSLPSPDTGPLAPPKPPFAGGAPAARPIARSAPDSPSQRHIARRHAGSFSYKDVEIGRALPNVPGASTFQAGLALAAETPTPRAALRAGFFTPKALQAHSRQDSQSSMHTSSTSSGGGGGSGPSTPSRVAVMIPDTPTDLSTLVDKEAIDAMAKAVDAAPPIWKSIRRLLEEGEAGEARDALAEMLGRAEGVTEKLSEGIACLHAGMDVDRKDMRETAHVFVKIVVQITVTLKQHGAAHPLSPGLRNAIVKLTNATEEFVILLHVSSFSSPRPYTPLTPLTSGAAPFEDAPRLTPSLSRSRSALVPSPGGTSRLAPDAPRSALPSQGFKVPTPPQRRLLMGDAIAVP
ncbi:RAM signaling pathway protein-domain-containing protein [Vararia minispora EC-137]|uniref:RAM signaling pathway protein-domain-containing protein n=1 Tax=Vararia minispora EC-137 TaxID=1314806 RepID=A0ACB8QW75_9AGAM|nr:RAM signaling pathway protein-domain-containing protein [Vararia minispora EC-137]